MAIYTMNQAGYKDDLNLKQAYAFLKQKISLK